MKGMFETYIDRMLSEIKLQIAKMEKAVKKSDGTLYVETMERIARLKMDCIEGANRMVVESREEAGGVVPSNRPDVLN